MNDPDRMFGRLGNRMFQMAKLYADAKDNQAIYDKGFLDIYFQDERWFEKYKDEIRALFGKDIKSQPYVSICVRRGDSVIKPDIEWRTNLAEETDYYKRAMERFKGHQFLVFSDDIEWCKNHFTGPQFTFNEIMDSDGNPTDPVKDMNRMAGCYAHIIGNSTFAWWAAYITPNLDAVVIAPKEEDWFRGKIYTKLPKNWIQI